MSEYQYYEFAAVDRPLDDEQMEALRAVSTGGRVTPTSFTNHYEWGGLKADPIDWVRRYFDAFVYTANWASCQLTLKLPAAAIDPKVLEPYLVDACLCAARHDGHLVLHWLLDESEDYDRFAEDDGRGWMARLLPLREELLGGDLRALYLGWLAAASRDQVPEGSREPEMPDGLGQLSAAQQALVEFLGVELDLLAAAAMGSAAATDAGEGQADAWLASLGADELRALLRPVLLSASPQSGQPARFGFRDWQCAQSPQCKTSAHRMVADLRDLAVTAGEQRRHAEARANAAREAKRRTQREEMLRTLLADVAARWADLHRLAEQGSASAYEKTVRALTDLAEAYALGSDPKRFDRDLRRFLVHHAKRAALLRRLTKAGLWSG